MVNLNDILYLVVLLTLGQYSNHAEPGVKEASCYALPFLVMPVSPLLHISECQLNNVNKRKDDNLSNGNVALVRDWGLSGRKSVGRHGGFLE
jgi:hypothetical protein